MLESLAGVVSVFAGVLSVSSDNLVLTSPGCSDFVITTSDVLAVLYSDQSPMEMHHCSSLFSLLRLPEFNILEAMPKASKEQLRKVGVRSRCHASQAPLNALLSRCRQSSGSC